MATRLNSRNKKKNTARTLVVILGVLLLILLGFRYFTGEDASSPADSSGSTASEYTKGESDDIKDGEAGEVDSDVKQGDAQSQPNRPLVNPTGNFVSSHKVSLSAEGLVASTCNSTPGATCNITFTKEGVSRSLGIKTLDAGGAAYWNWSPKDIDLTTGSWQVQAVATLGSQKLIGNDAMKLEVVR